MSDFTNRNPGGMRYRDGSFMSFGSVGSGLEHMASDITGKLRRGNSGDTNLVGEPLNTIRGVIDMWAPASDNNPTGQIIRTAEQILGVSADTPLPVNVETVSGLMSAIIKYESGMATPAETRAMAERVISGSGGPMLASAAAPARGNSRRNAPQYTEGEEPPLYASTSPVPQVRLAAYSPDDGDNQLQLAPWVQRTQPQPTLPPYAPAPAPQADDSQGFFGWLFSPFRNLFNLLTGNSSQPQPAQTAGAPVGATPQAQPRPVDLSPQALANEMRVLNLTGLNDTNLNTAELALLTGPAGQSVPVAAPSAPAQTAPLPAAIPGLRYYNI